MQTLTSFIIYDIYNAKKHPVEIEVNIGNGQQGSTILKLDTEVIGDEKNSFTKGLGPNNKLARKTLNLFTTIQDIQDRSDKISMDIKLKGGKIEHEQVIVDTTVSQPGSIVTAVVTIVFI